MLYSKRLLWIGCLESETEFIDKSRKGYKLASAQVSQQNILTGLENVTGLIFDSINGSVLPAYPVYADKVVGEAIWSHKRNAYNISVSYRNIKFINTLTCKNSMIKAARKWAKTRYNGEGLTIFAYSMRSPVMATACELKKLIPKAKIYLIITDLPQFMDLGQNKFKAFLKKIDWIQIKRMQQKFDGFILYASKMAEFLNIPDGKWMLMEGLYNQSELQNNIALISNVHTPKKKVIMYSGTLDLHYGINILLNSFMKIEALDLELWLTGGGNAEDYIKQCADKDLRIKFYGFLPSRQEVLQKQQEASVLINMRLPSSPSSAYCFPSKLLEYMATGVPVLSFKLDGIPIDYYEHLFIIENENEDSIIAAITKIMDMSDYDLYLKGKKAKKFILDEKNSVMQCERIYSFINH